MGTGLHKELIDHLFNYICQHQRQGKKKLDHIDS